MSLDLTNSMIGQVLMDANPQALLLVGENCRIMDGNLAMLRLYEFSDKPDLMSRDLFSLIATRSQTMFRYHYFLAADNLDIRSCTCFGIKNNGSDFVARITLSGFAGSEGQKLVLVIFEDISASYRELKTIRENEYKYRSIFNHAHLGLFHFNTDGIITECNDQFVEVMGSTRQALIGFDLNEVTDPGMLEQIRRSLEGLEGFYAGDYRSVTGNRLAPTRVIYDPIFDQDGQVTGGVGIVEDISEQQNAMKRLARREARLRLITDNMFDSIMQIDLDGNIVYMTPSHTLMTSWNEYNLVSRNIFDYIHPIDRTRLRHEFGTLIKNHKPVVTTYRSLHADGYYIWMESSANITLDENGDAAWIIVSVRDITERKHTEMALKASEERYRTIISEIADAYFEVDLEGRLQFYNEAMVRLQGYPESELKGLSYKTYSDNRNARKLYKVFHHVYETGKPVRDFEWDLRDHMGNQKTVETSVSPIFGMGMEVIGFRGILRDVTAHRAAQRALQESENRLRFLADNMQDLVNQVDRDGYIHYASPSNKTVLGYEPEELISKRLTRFIHPDDKNGALRMVYRSVREKATGRVEYRILHANGRYIWMETVGSPIFNEKGELMGGVFNSRDISDRKRMEEELRYMSLHDSLTGLYNRAYFEQEMQRLESGRYDPVGMIICDMDGLKIVNDKLGHAAGDRLIISVARVLAASFRESDVVARIGGDEFAVLMPSCSETILHKAVDRLKEKVVQHNEEHQDSPFSISLGAALRTGRRQRMSELFKDADNRMYMQKGESRHHYRDILENHSYSRRKD